MSGVVGALSGPAGRSPRGGGPCPEPVLRARVLPGGGTPLRLPAPAVRGDRPALVDAVQAPHAALHWLRGTGRCAAAVALAYPTRQGPTNAGASTGAYVSAGFRVVAAAGSAGGSAS